MKSGFLPYADPALDVDIDAVRLGMLTYRGVVKDSMQRKRKLLFTCDCGRVVIIPFPEVSVVDTGAGKHIEGIPWSCGECGAKEVGPKKKPWGLKYSDSQWKRRPLGQGLRTRQKKALRKCSKDMHRPEWYAWQQARRLSKGVVARWKKFDNFYSDMGDKPAGAKLAKHKRDRPHGPENSYWAEPTRLFWGVTEVSQNWVCRQFGIPRTFVMKCKADKIFDVQRIIAMYQSSVEVREALKRDATGK